MESYFVLQLNRKITTNPEFTVDSHIVNIVMQTVVNNDIVLFQWFLKQKKYIHEQYLRDIVKHTITVFVIQKDFQTIQLIYDTLGPLNFILQDAVINAVVQDYNDMLQFLYEKGADLRFSDDFPLVLACTNGKFSCVKYLISIGADINDKNNTSFIMSLSTGNLELVKYLLKNGADATCNNEEAMTIAESQFNLQLMKILLEHGCTGKNVTWETAKKFLQIREKNETKVRVDSVNKVTSWWTPFCYDLTKECGKRMIEKSWKTVSEMYDNFMRR
jgi:Ankyrin repeats (3 copies)